MRKLILIIGVVLMFGVSACRKERTCTCTYSYAGSGTYTDTYDLGTLTKAQAKTRCNRYEKTLELSGYSADCSL